jgi:uncharacterized protein
MSGFKVGSSFLNIFAKSPIKPLQQHMDLILKCIMELIPFIEAVLQEDWVIAEKFQSRIVQLESEADDLKKEIRLHVPNSLFMPITRSDFLGLLTAQDKIASKAKHISGLVLSRQMVFPKVMADQYIAFVKRSIDTAELAHKVINDLDDLIETGFRGKEVQIAEKMILELDKVERSTDNIQMQLRHDIFSIEKELNPIDAIFIYKIIDWTGELADRAQHVGHRLESLLAS